MNYSPDLHRSRFKKKVASTLVPFFKNNEFRFSKDKVKDVIKTFHELLIDEVIDNRDGVELPGRLGTLQIVSCKITKKKNIDFPKTNKLGRIVYHTNTETDGYVSKIFFLPNYHNYSFQYRTLWSFSGVRQFTRKVSKEYRKNWMKYVKIDAKVKARDTINQELYKMDLKNYNELEI